MAVSFAQFGLPIAIWLAVYDAWEARMLFDACFVTEMDSVHQVLNLLSWLCLALMGVCLQVDSHFNWTVTDAVLFSSLKFVHAFVRFLVYLEISYWAKSEKTRKAAFPRCIAFGSSLPIIFAAPFLAAYASPSYAGITWVVSYFWQRLTWALLLLGWPKFKSDAFNVRPNVPFIIRRLAEWIQIQIGASLLGLMTSNALLNEESDKDQTIACVIFLYIFLAFLDLLCYAISPSRPQDHALIAGGWREIIWLELYTLQGLGLFAIGVSIRAVLLLLGQVFVQTEDQLYVWVMVTGASIATVCAFVQERLHVGITGKVAGVKSWLFKISLSLSYLLIPVIAFYSKAEQSMVLCTLGMAIIAGIVIVAHIAFGGMKRELVRLTRVKFKGLFLATIIGKAWLRRARQRIAENRRLPPVLLPSSPRLMGKVFMRQPSTEAHDVDLRENVLKTKYTEVQEAPSDVTTDSEDDVASEHAAPLEPVSSAQRDAVAGARILTKVINESFYSPPVFVVKGDVFSEINSDWADLFIDVIFVGMIFRVGDFFLAGLGLEPAFPEPVQFCHEGTDHGATSSLWYAPLVYLFVFAPVLDVYFSRLAYAANVSVYDGFHKLYDLLQGLIIVVLASSLSTPQELSTGSPSVLTICACFLAFQASMLAKWIEAWWFNGHRAEHRHLAQFYMWAHALSLVPLVFSFATALTTDFAWTALLWFCSWVLSLSVHIERVCRKIAGRYEESSDTLAEFVEKRLMDFMLIVLGEAVMQVMRSRSTLTVDFGSCTLAFFIISAMRQLCFQTCFFDAKVLADPTSWLAVIDRFLRFATAPAVVSVGAAMKSLLIETKVLLNLSWMLCGACAATSLCFLLTLELALPSTLDLIKGSFLCLVFLVWAPIPTLPVYGLFLLCLVVWLGLNAASVWAERKRHARLPVKLGPGALQRQKAVSRFHRMRTASLSRLSTAQEMPATSSSAVENNALGDVTVV